MNRSTRAIILDFLSREDAIRSILNNYFTHAHVHAYTREQLRPSMYAYAQGLSRDLNNSEPLPNVSLADQADCVANQYIQYQIGNISTHILDLQQCDTYTVNDGAATSTAPRRYQDSADRMLNIWRVTPARGISLREDTQSDVYTHGWEAPQSISTGITFCDQSGLGTQNHMRMYEESKYKHALNAGTRAHERAAFGVVTDAADERLLSRRVFRDENAIPARELRLHRRAIDRDPTEGLRSGERDYILQKHDMSSLLERLKFREAPQMPSTHMAAIPRGVDMYPYEGLDMGKSAWH